MVRYRVEKRKAETTYCVSPMTHLTMPAGSVASSAPGSSKLFKSQADSMPEVINHSFKHLMRCVHNRNHDSECNTSTNPDHYCRQCFLISYIPVTVQWG
jgi:hypothetical protein